jgi:hypothetical protein
LASLPAQATSIKVVGKSIDRCIQNAAEYHEVDPQLLRAILMVESRLNPKAMNRNTNGTRDIGVAQINSIHLPVLKVHGIQEDHLKDACINTYVGAWILRTEAELVLKSRWVRPLRLEEEGFRWRYRTPNTMIADLLARPGLEGFFATKERRAMGARVWATATCRCCMALFWPWRWATACSRPWA